MPTVKTLFAALLAAIAAGALAFASSAQSTSRSGELQVTKECSSNQGRAGDFCTITTSNIDAIEVGSRVIYASAAGDPTPGQLNSDLIIDGPGPGNNKAYGHVVLDFETLTGVVTFSGGTGKFRGFHGRVDVSPIGFPYFAWDGTYSFDPPGAEK